MKEISEIIYNIAAAIAILIGGGWTFWKFVIQREKFPKPQFDLDLKVIGKQNKKYIIELSALLTNKSAVRLIIPKFYFSLFILEADEEIDLGDDRINESVKFKKVIDQKLWLSYLKNANEYTFVDSGSEQRYSFVTSLPDSATFALLQSRFEYKERASDFHSAQKCFKIDLPLPNT